MPSRDDEKTFSDICLSRRTATRSRLTSVTPSVLARYRQYLRAKGVPSTLDPQRFDPEVREALISNYDQLSSGRSFAGIRAELLSLARAGRCPMCDGGPVATLDHYLPKSVFPEFSVMPKNLVPVCYRCNNIKQDVIEESGRRFLHSYFEDPPIEALLDAEVSVEESVTITFRASYSGEAPSVAANYCFQFERLRLADYFQLESVAELCDRSLAMQDYFGDDGDSSAVREYLEREAASVASLHGVNHWKAALFSAASKSTAFCNGGFLQLLHA
ncbi:HNH endonuclease [Paractinoplanes hotanensis]|uniref:HNH endonuclease n=1 Tax=Paractinoplanes hotanensis TaxID=2906497 RepID=A0ABT0YGJ7_9ACTN|nr:HNH endonuclease signature motif containing protein [Actinoplanes hotanensis]MCM4085154.1 HNH endonuclease [Actinoplanes hotanensis]